MTEAPVLLGDTRAPGTTPQALTPRLDYQIKGVDYRATVWITAISPQAPDTVSRGKRVTVRTELGPTGTPLDGACTGSTRCITESIVRSASGSDTDPVTGSSAASTSKCTSATSETICEAYVRSGRVLDGAELAAGDNLTVLTKAVDLYARTSKPMAAVTARWTFETRTPNGTSKPVTITRDLTPDVDSTRWNAQVTPDDQAEADKAMIRPGQVTVTFVAQAPDGTTSTRTTTAFWSYQLSGILQVPISARQTAASTYCQGTGKVLQVKVAGSSMGLDATNYTHPPTAAADTLEVVFPITSGAGRLTTVKVPATMTGAEAQYTTVDGTQLATSAVTTWTATAPAALACAGTEPTIVMHRASDQTDTVTVARKQ